MDITIYRSVDVTHLTHDQVEVVRASNENLKPHEHAPDCPVHHGASMDCVWPLAVCYGFSLKDVYNIDHSPPSARSPSENPPPAQRPTRAQRPDLYECELCGPKPGSPELCGRCRVASQRAGNAWIGAWYLDPGLDSGLDPKHGPQIKDISEREPSIRSTSQLEPHLDPDAVASALGAEALGSERACLRCGRKGLTAADGLWCSKCRNKFGND